MQAHAALKDPHSVIALLGDSRLLHTWGVGRPVHKSLSPHILLPALRFFAMSLVVGKIKAFRCLVIPFGYMPRRWSAGCIEALRVGLLCRAILGAIFPLHDTIPYHGIKHSPSPSGFCLY